MVAKTSMWSQKIVQTTPNMKENTQTTRRELPSWLKDIGSVQSIGLCNLVAVEIIR